MQNNDASTGIILAIVISFFLYMIAPNSDNYEDRPECEPTAYYSC